MTNLMKLRALVVLAACVLAAVHGTGQLAAQTPAATAFKLGTFRQASRTFVGAVVNDTQVIDLGAADPTLPREMKAIIAGYATLRPKIAAAVSKGARVNVSTLTVLPPVMPRIILNATLNYQEHANELSKNPGIVSGVSVADTQMKPGAGVPGLWTRAAGDTRHNPYFFQKPTTAVIGHGEAIRLPRGRTQIDAECELTIVVGRTASYVPVDKANDYIFGYTIQNDVSDRRGRADARHGSDWFVAKGFDTAAPIGPFIVPKEFVPDPQKLAVKLTLNDRVMTNSNTSRMTHNVRELLSFVTNVTELQPGDMVDTGSPAGGARRPGCS